MSIRQGGPPKWASTSTTIAAMPIGNPDGELAEVGVKVSISITIA